MEVDIPFLRELHIAYGVAVVEHVGASVPYVAKVEFTASKPSSGFNAVDNHSGHLADAALWEFLHYLLHVLDTFLGIAAVELTQSTYEEELIAVSSERESRCRYLYVAGHLVVSVGLESLVRGCIYRIFEMHTEL